MGRAPSLYLFDTDDPGSRRPWARMLPEGYREVRLEGGRFVHTGGEAADGVVVIHASRLPGEEAQRRLFEQAGRAGLTLVIVSGGLQRGAPAGGHVYRRRRPVRVRDYDGEFSDSLRRFWAQLLETGTARFELLEPSRGMLLALTVLCQGYLLARWRTEAPTGGAIAALTRLGWTEVPLVSAEAAWILAAGWEGWWRPIDAAEARREIESSGGSSPAIEALLAEISGGGPVHPATVLAAYEALESHLRARASE